MNYNEMEVTLLSEGDVISNDEIDVIKKAGRKCSASDFALILGGIASDIYHVEGDFTLSGRATEWWTSSILGQAGKVGKYDEVAIIAEDGSSSYVSGNNRMYSIRPVIEINDSIEAYINANKKLCSNRLYEVELGEYPQYKTDIDLKLQHDYNLGILRKTGKTYTVDSTPVNEYDKKFQAAVYEEYEFNGRKFVHLTNTSGYTAELSDDDAIGNGEKTWIEVKPIKWYVDESAGLLVSKIALLSGIQCIDNSGPNTFYTSNMFNYLNTQFIKDIVPSELKEEIKEAKDNKKEINPYGLKFKEVSEEDIIKGAIETGVAVFLHGPSSEGKSARIKAIDPDCKIIYLRNASPDSLNGKSVYNEQTGEMIDVKPTWLKQLEEKCEKEKDKLHIVFFDEITNALPSIQGIAFNIVLDREVNGMWKLPENARIVAAGNDMKDSLAANQLAEPLYNRFAHVFIKTTTMGWLKWASEHNIHPAIYSFIAYKKGSVLRSEYTGDKPNADPRKWEMASNMLYKTENPNMLRALVGEDITKEFVQFCKQKVITLEDVLKSEYKKEDVDKLNTAEKYATVMGISMAEEKDLEKVRDFAKLLGSEITAVFDAMWARGDETRLERIAEVKLKDKKEVKETVTESPKEHRERLRRDIDAVLSMRDKFLTRTNEIVQNLKIIDNNKNNYQKIIDIDKYDKYGSPIVLDEMDRGSRSR